MSEVQGSWMQFLINSIRSEVEDGPAMEPEPAQPDRPLDPGTWRCLVCSRPHNSILVLPCQHKFCARCLHLWVGIYIDMYRGHGGEFPCQVCWTVFQVPAEGLAVYAQDFQVRQLQEGFGNISMETAPVAVETPQAMATTDSASESTSPREGNLPTPGTTIICNPGYCYQGYKSQACQLPHHLMWAATTYLSSIVIAHQ